MFEIKFNQINVIMTFDLAHVQSFTEAQLNELQTINLAVINFRNRCLSFNRKKIIKMRD